jgi:hypothetical protein
MGCQADACREQQQLRIVAPVIEKLQDFTPHRVLGRRFM